MLWGIYPIKPWNHSFCVKSGTVLFSTKKLTRTAPFLYIYPAGLASSARSSSGLNWRRSRTVLKIGMYSSNLADKIGDGSIFS